MQLVQSISCIITFWFVVALCQTTPHFPEVFVGKCYDKNPSGVDCHALFGNFSEAAMTDNSLVNDTLYDPFFAMANFSTPESSILFWSGNMAFALAISTNDPRFVTVEETSTGYILNSLSWCGTPAHDFDYVNPCYYPSNGSYYGSSGVWTRASKMFAHGAAGQVYVLLQPASIGGSPPVYQAFRNTSIFGQTELPNMDVTRVKNITVLLLKNKVNAPDELCGQGSLLTLKQRIEDKFNFTPTCVDDSTLIYSILCPPHGQLSAQCLAATLVYAYETQQAHDNLVWAAVITGIACALFVIVCFLAMRLWMASRKGYEPVAELKASHDYKLKTSHSKV